MILSSCMLKRATEKKDDLKYKLHNDWEKAKYGLFVVLSIVFFLMELTLLVFAIRSAVRNSSTGADRVVHIFLAIFATVPYLLFDVFLSENSGVVSTYIV